MDSPDPVAETRDLKARMEEARAAFDAYLSDAVAAETQRMHHDHDAARSLALQTGMESRRLSFEMRLSDWQQANFEAAERRNQEERARHESDAHAASERAHRLNVVLAFCGAVGVVATIVSTAGTAVQAYAALRPATPVAPVTSSR